MSLSLQKLPIRLNISTRTNRKIGSTRCRSASKQALRVRTCGMIEMRSKPVTTAAKKCAGAALLTATGLSVGCEQVLAGSASFIDPSMLTLGEIDPGTAVLLATFLRPVLSIGSLLMILRIVMTWFPEVKDKEMPWLLAYLPTEPVLGPTRKIIQPVGGVDVSPIVWVAMISFFNEILLGPQGLLILLSQKVN